MFGSSKGVLQPLASAIFIAIMLLSYLAPVTFNSMTVSADKDDKSDPGREEGRVEVEKGAEGFDLRTAAEGAMGKEALELKAQIKDGLEIELTLQHEQNRVSTRITVGLRFLCLVGLKDGETPQSVGCGEKERTTLRFSKMTFNEPYYGNYTSSDTTIHKFEVSSKDGKFRLKLELTGDFTIKDNGTPQPDPIAMHIKVHEIGLAKDDKFLGLKMEVRSNVMINMKRDLPEHDNTKEGVSEKPDPSDPKDEELGSMFLALNDKATVDGEQKDVSSSLTEGSNGALQIAIAYPKGDTIQHDLELGIVPRTIELRGDLPLFAAGIVAIVAVFAITDKFVLAKILRKK